MKLTIGDQSKVFSTTKDISCKDVELSNDWAEGRSSLLEDNSDKIQEQTRTITFNVIIREGNRIFENIMLKNIERDH